MNGLYSKKDYPKANFNPTKKIIRDVLCSTFSAEEDVIKSGWWDLRDNARDDPKLWESKYRLFSAIPENQRLLHGPNQDIPTECKAYHPIKQKEIWQKVQKASKDSKNLELAVRPTGAAKSQMLNGWESLTISDVKDKDGRCFYELEKVMNRLEDYIALSQSKNYMDNNIAWKKYHFFNGGMNNTDRFQEWRNQIQPDQDCVQDYFQERRKQRWYDTRAIRIKLDEKNKKKKMKRVKRSEIEVPK